MKPPVLATYHIRSLNQVFESTFPCLSQLADSPEEEYHRNVFICSSSKGVMYTVHGILIFIKRLTRLCLQSLRHHFINWTKPDTATFLMVGTLTDLARSKSELVAENALLRQQLIILRRHAKRPVCAKTDRMLLVFLARMVRTWKQALFIVQEDDALAVAPSGIQAVLEGQVHSGFCHTEDLPRDHGLDQGNGQGQPTVGSGTDPGRIAQAGSWRLQTHDTEIPETGAHSKATRTELENLLRHSCPADLGL
jgi:hypothetical protein